MEGLPKCLMGAALRATCRWDLVNLGETKDIWFGNRKEMQPNATDALCSTHYL
jgi:hypothetical protein